MHPCHTCTDANCSTQYKVELLVSFGVGNAVSLDLGKLELVALLGPHQRCHQLPLWSMRRGDKRAAPAGPRFRIGGSDLELFGNEEQTSRDKKALETR